jgi:hypothetical protein
MAIRATQTRWALFLIAITTGLGKAQGQPPTFDRVVIDDEFPGAYQVEVADVDGDGKPDIVALGGGTCAWYQNPTWTKRVITGPDQSPDVISSATADLDGDGKAEVAIAYDFEMNQPKRGKLLLASQGESIDSHWRIKPQGDFPSIHRLRWLDFDNDGRLDLIVAPIFGPGAQPPTYDQGSGQVVALLTARFRQPLEWHWSRLSILERPVIHAIEALPSKDKKHQVSSLLVASNLGVDRAGYDAHPQSAKKAELVTTQLFSGAEGPPPRRGSSEVHFGYLARDPQENSLQPQPHFIATVEPWHGSQVAIWSAQLENLRWTYKRTVIDDSLADGHALWVVDVDGDGDDEVFAGHRGPDHRVSVYDLDRKSGTWARTVIDREIAAQDLRGGDLDGNGTPDIVAVGGTTHNVVWYRPKAR